jgi:hypothetical protein
MKKVSAKSPAAMKKVSAKSPAAKSPAAKKPAAIKKVTAGKAAPKRRRPAAKKSRPEPKPKSQRRPTLRTESDGVTLDGRKPKRVASSEPAHLIEIQQRDDPVSRPVTAYESEALSLLALELAPEEARETDAKIAERLRDKQLGPFDTERVGVLRAFKSDVADELHRGKSSDYFVGQHGLYANPEDFDYERLARDFAARYPSISHEAVAAFIPIAVYCYYLR